MDYGMDMDLRFGEHGLWNGYGFRILENMDYGMDMDLVLNPFGPIVYIRFTDTVCPN